MQVFRDAHLDRFVSKTASFFGGRLPSCSVTRAFAKHKIFSWNGRMKNGCLAGSSLPLTPPPPPQLEGVATTVGSRFYDCCERTQRAETKFSPENLLNPKVTRKTQHPSRKFSIFHPWKRSDKSVVPIWICDDNSTEVETVFKRNINHTNNNGRDARRCSGSRRV